MSSITRSPNVILCQAQPGFYRLTHKGVVTETVSCLFIIPIHLSDLDTMTQHKTHPQRQPRPRTATMKRCQRCGILSPENLCTYCKREMTIEVIDLEETPATP